VDAVLRAGWRHLRMVLLVGLCVFSLAAITILQLTAYYSAETMILLSSSSTGEIAEGANRSPTDSFVVRSEVDILSANEVALRVIRALDLERHPEFDDKSNAITRWLRDSSAWLVGALGISGQRSGPGNLWSAEEAQRNRVLAAYRNRLGVYNDGRSSTVRISFWAESPRLAAAVANAHARAYLSQQAERRIESQRLATDWLRREIDARAEVVKAAEAATQ
jgi:uncharacterized protein involved in exopolysaccharide biosynthesis